MPSPSADPAVAAMSPPGTLYFQQAVPDPGQIIQGGGRSAPTGAQSMDVTPPKLMFGEGTAYTASGEAIVQAANNGGRGHWSEILNFHGSPAPWILIGLLLVAGILHASAEGKFKLGGRV